MPTFRIIRCANAQLYIGATLLVLGAAAYVLCCKDALWQQVAAIAAAIITPIWTAFYVCLKYTVDSTGITRSSLLGSTDLPVGEIAYACGFNDSNYFSYKFKKTYGVTPRFVKKRKND